MIIKEPATIISKRETVMSAPDAIMSGSHIIIHRRDAIISALETVIGAAKTSISRANIAISAFGTSFLAAEIRISAAEKTAGVPAGLFPMAAQPSTVRLAFAVMAQVRPGGKSGIHESGLWSGSKVSPIHNWSQRAAALLRR